MKLRVHHETWSMLAEVFSRLGHAKMAVEAREKAQVDLFIRHADQRQSRVHKRAQLLDFVSV